MRLACSTACFPEDRLEVAVAKVAWAGYGAVELAIDPGRPPAEEEALYRIQSNDLELAAVFAGVLPLTAEGDDFEALAAVGRAAALARTLDCGLVVLRAPADGTLQALAGTLRLLQQALAGVEVDVCLANHAHSILPTPEAVAALLEEYGAGAPGWALDPAQAVLAGSSPADFLDLASPPRHVYLNDAACDRVVPPGEGGLDLPGLVASLGGEGYSGALSLQLENADPWAVDPLVRELRETAQLWLTGA